MRRRVFLILTLCTALAAATHAQSGLPAGAVAKIERSISAEMERQKIPGLSAAVVTDWEVRWSKGFGLSDLENSVPAKPETSFRLGSIAKPVAALAAMQLVEEGELDLDAPVQKYVPTFPEKPWPVTCRQLLGHLGGIRHYRGDEINITRHYSKLADGLAIFKDDPLLHEPGTKYAYSTYGYNLLGCAVEGASGKSFVDYITERIFKPAGTQSLRADSVTDIIPHRAQGYRKLPSGELRNAHLADTSYKIPGGGLCGSVLDLSKLAIAVQQGRIVKPATLEQMWTRQSLKGGTQTAYGLGWGLASRNGMREVAHGGGQQRISTYLYMLPERKCAVALMSNLEGAQLAGLARGIADAALGK
jgi:serine beta-lactamase-like protein LACTB, mitochondrial